MKILSASTCRALCVARANLLFVLQVALGFQLAVADREDHRDAHKRVKQQPTKTPPKGPSLQDRQRWEHNEIARKATCDKK